MPPSLRRLDPIDDVTGELRAGLHRFVVGAADVDGGRAVARDVDFYPTGLPIQAALLSVELTFSLTLGLSFAFSLTLALGLSLAFSLTLSFAFVCVCEGLRLGDVRCQFFVPRGRAVLERCRKPTFLREIDSLFQTTNVGESAPLLCPRRK
jgi:hypothetical protein